MPENQPELPLATPAPSSTQTGTTSIAPATSPEPWRAGPEAPAWARGKTAEELIAYGNQANSTIETWTRQAPPPAPTAQAQSGTVPVIDPQAYATGQDILNAQQAAVNQFAPALQRLAEQNAAATYRLVASDGRFKEVFDRYGPEVTQYLARVPREQWTVDIVEGAAKLVRGDHLDELARERANQIVQGMEPTIRPTGGGTTPAHPTPDLSLKSEKLPQDWRERAAKVGLDERALDEFCMANGMSREQFFKQFESSLIVEVGKIKGA